MLEVVTSPSPNSAASEEGLFLCPDSSPHPMSLSPHPIHAPNQHWGKGLDGRVTSPKHLSSAPAGVAEKRGPWQ